MRRMVLHSTLALIVEAALTFSGALLTGCHGAGETSTGTAREKNEHEANSATDARSVEPQPEDARSIQRQLGAIVDQDEFSPVELRTTPPISRTGFGDAVWGLEVLRKAAGLDWVGFVPYKDAVAKPQETGIPCATSTDKAACRKRIAAARVEGAVIVDGDASYLGSYATSKGDAVHLARRKTEVASLFGIVDSPAKARLVAMAYRYELKGDQWVHSTNSGFELIGSIDTGRCGRRLEDQRVEVRADGSLTVLERVQTLLEDQRCYERRP